MNEKKINSRRQLLKNIVALGAMAPFAPPLVNASDTDQNNGEAGYTFLFQGDSITDGNRGRNNDWNHVMGHGYQYIIASKLWYEFPAKGLHFFNRGVSGNKVTDLANRWQDDTIALKPDLLSILVGINDTSAFINGNKDFATEAYERDYNLLLQQTQKYLPDIQLVLCEPFILPVGKVKEKWEEYAAEVKKRQLIVKN